MKKTEYIIDLEVKMLDIIGVLAPNSLISISKKSEDDPLFNSTALVYILYYKWYLIFFIYLNLRKLFKN